MLTQMGGNGVDVGGVAGERDLGAAAAGQIDHALHQVMRAFRSFVFDNGFERVEPFLGFHYVRIIGGLRHNEIELG